MDENQNNEQRRLTALFILIGIVSLIIRQFLIPNPLGSDSTYFLVNLATELLIHTTAILFHHKIFLIDDCHPMFGSLSYLTTRILCTAIVYGAMYVYTII